MNNSNHSVKKLTILYISALSLVALLTIVGQLFVQKSLSDHMHDAKIINLAGRQRFQSQSIVKNILILTDTANVISDSMRKVYQNRLDGLLKSWEHFHEGLKKGFLPEYEYNVSNSDTIKLLFGKIEPHFESVYGSALTIKFLGKETTHHNYDEVKQLRTHILQNEYEFLQLMDKIVYQLSKESEEKVKKLELYEKILMSLTLFILLFEGFFVFKPAVNQIRKYIVELVNTKDILEQTNLELIQTNEVLKQTQDELKMAEKEKYQRRFEEQMIRSASLIKGQEDERRRLSKELHDGLGQLLTALKFDLEKLDVDKNDIAKNKAIISEAKNIVSQTINETRNIAFNLMPSILNDFGLIPTITLIGEQIKTKYSIEVLFNSNIMDEARYNQEIEIALYRIIQEATNNVVKHADATRIYLDLFENDLELTLKISDNGKGFQIKNVKKNKENHSGLNNMEERVKLLDGTFSLTSKKGDGVLIEIKIPIKI